MAARSARKRKAARNRAAQPAGAKRRTKRPWWRRWWMLLLVIPAMLLGALGLLAFYIIFSSVPLPDDIEARSSIVYDVDGEEVGGLAAEIARQDVAFGDLPEHVSQAVLAAEDRDFYEHRGISVTGIARALFTNVRSGSIRGGGSTVSQQYIKNAALTPEQTYRRKVEEAALAIKLEREYEKDEILGFYLNTSYWGRGTYGIGAASETYYGIPASELSVNQAATLAGILPAPEAYDPLENPDRAETRRRYVLDGMLQEGYLTQSEHDDLVEEGLPEVTDRPSIDRGPNAYYLDAVRRELAALPEFEQGGLFRGLRIFTELDQDLQAAAQDTMTRAIAEEPVDTGAIVTVAPQTGAVHALVGGRDATEQPFNTALRSVRQPGSTFKAFTFQAYLEAGGAPDDRFSAPAELEFEENGTQDTIRNFGGASFGEQTVRQATASSTNTVYIQMQEEAGRELVIDAAGRAGLPTDKAYEVFPTERGGGDTMRPFPGLTLGQDLFTPLELASAYATYAAEGHHVTPHLVVRVEDADGRIVYEPDIDEDQSVELQVARGVTDGLVEVVTSGSGTAADLGRPVAGKTGTTNDSRDVWFVGYVPQLSTSLWLGNLDNSPIEAENATGGGMAAPWWRDYMEVAVADLEVMDFTPPEDVEREAEAACPAGYRFADPPNEADADGFFPDILTDITDDEGRPCVEVKPEPEECPAGYEFAQAPDGPDEFGRTPDVLTDVTDFQGRPCVEVLQDPECPAGYEFAQAPDGPDEFGRTPDVIGDITDAQGRPCVEVLGEPPEEEPPPPDDEEPPPDDEEPPPDEEEPPPPDDEEPPPDDEGPPAGGEEPPPGDDDE